MSSKLFRKLIEDVDQEIFLTNTWYYFWKHRTDPVAYYDAYIEDEYQLDSAYAEASTLIGGIE